MHTIHPIESINLPPLTQTFHPHLLIPLNLTSPDLTQLCNLHLHLSLPDALFIDRDELTGTWTSGTVVDTWWMSPEVVDIERPEMRDGEGSTLDLRMKGGSGSLVEVDVPLHARYLEPSEVGHRIVSLFGDHGQGQLQGGWVCDTHTKGESDPLDLRLSPEP
jgi:hypothetical protein